LKFKNSGIKAMAGHICPPEEEITHSNIGAARAILPRDLKDAALQSRARLPDESEICNDQIPALTADNSLPLYSSRIINNYIEFLAKLYP
jgi:hypothetical protein